MLVQRQERCKGEWTGDFQKWEAATLFGRKHVKSRCTFFQRRASIRELETKCSLNTYHTFASTARDGGGGREKILSNRTS